jgi:addiction module RelB/DinJ family antitoxin
MMTTIQKDLTIKSSQSLVQIKLDADLKNQSQAFFSELGLSFTDGIKIYLKYVTKNQRIPFSLTTKLDISDLPVVTPSPELEASINQSMVKIKNGTANLMTFATTKERDDYFLTK